jgi:hypothetical protein
MIMIIDEIKNEAIKLISEEDGRYKGGFKDGWELCAEAMEQQQLLNKHEVSGQSEQLPPQETALWKELLGYNAELQMQLGRSSQDERVVKLAEKYAVTRR